MQRNPNPPPPGKGRIRGSKNKFTLSAKDAFQKAYEGLGGANALKEWAEDNKTDFYKLYAKLIPTETSVTVNKHEEALDALK